MQHGDENWGVAQEAKAAGVPVYTVALGSPGATIPNPTGFGPPKRHERTQMNP